MGALLVEGADELIEARLLLQEVPGGGLGGFLLERQMHALMPAVLLRMAGLDALDADTQAQPPDRELGQSEERVGTGKGAPVIGANRSGQPEVLKSALKDGKGVHRQGAREPLTADEVTAREVGDGERKAVASIGEHELALVVGTPEVIGMVRVGERGAFGLVDSPASTLNQAVTVQDRMHGADGRGVDLGGLATQAFADFRSTPAGVLLLELHDRLLDLKGELPDVPRGSRESLRQPLDAAVLVALEDLVAGLARDLELPAQHRHLVPVQQPGHELQPLVHLATLPPR